MCTKSPNHHITQVPEIDNIGICALSSSNNIESLKEENIITENN